MARTLERLRREESGFALVLALVVTVALGTAVTSVSYFVTSNSGHAERQRSDQNALALAEAGLNLAFSTLEHAPSPSLSSAVSSTPVADIPMAGGFVSYFGTYDATTKVWSLTGLGKAYDPNRPGSFIVRQVGGRAQIGTATIGGTANGAWRYIYSDDPNSCATLSNNTVINVPVYVQGSLCLNNSARIVGQAVQVGGRVTLNNTQTSIGTAASPMTEIHIGQGCSTDAVVYHSPCSSADRVYGAQAPDTNLTPMSKPPVDLAGWYQNAQPGPMHPCTFGSFPGGFDTNAVRDRSRSTVDLTPRTAYDCRVYDATGALVGRLSWTPGAPGSLVIQGTIYFDGNITMSQLVDAEYSGRATIYSSGTISLANQVHLCPVGGCGPNWDPNVHLLTFVAGSSTDQYGFSIGNNSTFEGAVYCVNDYIAGNSSAVWGPVIARQINISNSTFNSFPPIMNLMSGMPSASYTTVETVNLVSGSWDA
jgi:type II secretory pathway pseudopilin PulG